MFLKRTWLCLHPIQTNLEASEGLPIRAMPVFRPFFKKRNGFSNHDGLPHPHHSWTRGTTEWRQARSSGHGGPGSQPRAGAWCGGGPPPVGDEVAGVAMPPQGQYGLSHLFHWEHFLKEIILLKNRDEARMCVDMSRWCQTEPGDTGRQWPTLILICSTWPHLTRTKKFLHLRMKQTWRHTQSQQRETLNYNTNKKWCHDAMMLWCKKTWCNDDMKLWC